MISQSTAASRAGTRVIRKRLAGINVSVRSDLSGLLDDVATMYRGFDSFRASSGREIRMEVRANPESPLRRRRYFIVGDGEDMGPTRRRDEVLPFLEWGVNWRVIASRTEFLQVHAASMTRSGSACIFAATSGQGKSTLAAGLLKRGWQYGCDELALIHSRSLRLHPFPKAICIKAGSFDAVEQMKLPFAGRRYHVKGLKGKVAYINPLEVRDASIAQPCPIRYVFFPRYTEGAVPRVYRVSRGRAVLALLASTLNRDALGDEAPAILTSVVSGAECYGLEMGSLWQTCELLTNLLDEGA